MNTSAPVLAVRRPWFWILFAVISAACGALAWRMFPVAFPVLSLDIRMDRAGAIRTARQLAAENKWGPGIAARDAASFGVNSQAQAFVELEGGGKKVFASLLREGLADVRPLGIPAYGFIPCLLSQEERDGFHAHDEFLTVENLNLGLEVMYEVVRRLCEAQPSVAR